MILLSTPHLVSSSNKSLYRSNASPVSHNCLYSSIVVFLGLVCAEISFQHREMSWMGGKDALVCPLQGKVMLVERVCDGVAYAGGDGIGLFCCFCLFSSWKWLRAVLANCLFWCKQGSAPGSSGSELWCLNRLMGYTLSMTECHWNAVEQNSRACCPGLARGVWGRQRWKKALIYLVWHVKHYACGNSRLY